MKSFWCLTGVEPSASTPVTVRVVLIIVAALLFISRLQDARKSEKCRSRNENNFLDSQLIVLLGNRQLHFIQ